MLYKGLLATSMSGSLDGLVASHNRGGPYFRNRVVPTDPASGRQLECRQALANCYTRWGTELTAEDRSQWESFARHSRIVNRIGDDRTLSGFDAFCRQAYNWAHAKIVVNSSWVGPTVPPYRPSLLPVCPPISLLSGNVTVRVAFDDTAAWVDTIDCALLFYIGRTTTQFVNFYKGPYHLVDGIRGYDEDPPESPWDIDITGFGPGTAQRVWWRMRFLDIGADLQQAWAGYFDQVVG